MTTSLTATPANPTSSAANRLVAVDMLKAFAIFAVVFIHSDHFILAYPSRQIHYEVLEFLVSGLRFCVPVFITIWAYFMEKAVLKKGTGIFFPRFIGLFVPFLFWSAIYFVILADFKHLTITQVITKHFTGYGWAGQYYFIILFQLILLFPLVRYVAHRMANLTSIVYVLSIVFFIFIFYSGWQHISVVGKISARFFIYWIPYTMLGIIYANKSDTISKIPFYIAALSIFLVPIERHFHSDSGNPYLIPTVFLSAMLLANAALHLRLKYSDIHSKAGNVIRIVAENTFGIFCLNPLINISIGPYLRALHLHLQFPGYSIFIPVFSTVIVISICLLIIFLFKKIKLSFLVAN